MPDKILAAISPAYGIATGTGPYKDTFGPLGRLLYDRQAEKREDKKNKRKLAKAKAEAEAEAEAEALRAELGRPGSPSVDTRPVMTAKGGGRVRNSGKPRGDGMAQRGRTRGRIV